MPGENLLDSIHVISDGINAMNDRLANMLPVAGFNALEKKRDEALDRLHFLVKLFVTGNTKRFIEADSQLAVVNEDLKEVLQEVEDLQTVLDNATRFVSAIDSFITSVVQIV